MFISSWRLEGSEFHAFGPAYEKARSPNLSFSFGVSYWKLLAERSLSRPGRSAVAVIMSARYAGLRPMRTWCINYSPKVAKIVGGWGSAPDPAGGAYSAPPDPLAALGWDGDFKTLYPPVKKSWVRACSQVLESYRGLPLKN